MSTSGFTRGARDQAVAMDGLETYVLERLIDRLTAAGAQTLVFKGAALARSHYADSWRRPRGDVDVLIRPTDFATADRVLAADGWQRAIEHDNPAITRQVHYDAPAGWPIRLDLHLAMFNVAGLSRSFDDLWTHRRSLPGLGAPTISNADALWHAAVHRVVHHANADDRVWLEDVHLLAESLDAGEWDRVERIASTTGTLVICGASVRRASAVFGTSVPAHVQGWASTTGEPLAIYLTGLSELAHQAHTLRRLDRRQQLALVRAHLLPSVRYMRGRYPSVPAILIPAAYVHRAVAGAVRWIREWVLRAPLEEHDGGHDRAQEGHGGHP